MPAGNRGRSAALPAWFTSGPGAFPAVDALNAADMQVPPTWTHVPPAHAFHSGSSTVSGLVDRRWGSNARQFVPRSLRRRSTFQTAGLGSCLPRLRATSPIVIPPHARQSSGVPMQYHCAMCAPGRMSANPAPNEHTGAAAGIEMPQETGVHCINRGCAGATQHPAPVLCPADGSCHAGVTARTAANVLNGLM